jgi:hypothetical protein
VIVTSTPVFPFHRGLRNCFSNCGHGFNSIQGVRTFTLRCRTQYYCVWKYVRAKIICPITLCCKMVYFSNRQIPIWVNFCRIWQWEVYIMAIWYILRPFGIFYGHLVYFTAIWYILRQCDIFYGNVVYFTAIWSILRPLWYVVPRKIWQPCYHWFSIMEVNWNCDRCIYVPTCTYLCRYIHM